MKITLKSVSGRIMEDAELHEHLAQKEIIPAELKNKYFTPDELLQAFMACKKWLGARVETTGKTMQGDNRDEAVCAATSLQALANGFETVDTHEKILRGQAVPGSGTFSGGTIPSGFSSSDFAILQGLEAQTHT